MKSPVNSTACPHLAATGYAPEDELIGDRSAGTTLGKFRILRRVGRGGMGVVYEAVDPILDRRVAIKVLRDGLSSDQHAARKFIREARTAAKLNHPHVVAVYETDQEKGIVYLVMELMEGGSAHDRIGAWGPFGWVEATQVMAEACRGLVAVHSAGLIHRDIKPSNVMRTKDGLVKLADFGLALSMAGPADSSVRAGQIVGTPLYMSPEQCRGQPVDPRSDIYAMGATYYTLLTGLPPFEGSSSLEIMTGHCSRSIPDPCAVNSHIPARCAELLRRAMAKEPDQRSADADSLLGDLQAILALASTPDTQPLNWAAANHAARLAHTPTSDGFSTAIQAVAPIYVTTRKPRTRAWFVGICLILMALAWIVGQQFSLVPPGQMPTNLQAPDLVNGTPVLSRVSKMESRPSEITTQGAVRSLSFDPNDPDTLIWATDRGIITVKKLLFGEPVLVVEAQADLKPVSVDQVGCWPAKKTWMSLYDGRLHLYEKDKQVLNNLSWSNPPNCRINTFVVHPLGEMMAFSYHDSRSDKEGIVFRWPTGQTVDCDISVDDSTASLAFSADGSFFLRGRHNGLVQIWKLKSNFDGPQTILDNQGRSTSSPINFHSIAAMVSYDASHFAIADRNQITLFDAAEGLKEYLNVSDAEGTGPSTDSISALAVSLEKKRLAVAAGNRILLYDLPTKKMINEWTDHQSPVTAITFDAKGIKLATGDADGKIMIRSVD